MPDCRTCLAGPDKAQPVWCGPCIIGDINGDDIAIAQFGLQRRALMVDSGRYRMVTHTGMNRIRKIKRSCPTRQRNNGRLGGKHINRIRKQINFYMLKKLSRIARLILNIQQRLQPSVCALLQVGQGRVFIFVQPVRGYAGLSHMLHFFGTDLKLNRGAIRAD